MAKFGAVPRAVAWRDLGVTKTRRIVAGGGRFQAKI